MQTSMLEVKVSVYFHTAGSFLFTSRRLYHESKENVYALVDWMYSGTVFKMVVFPFEVVCIFL